MSGAVHLHLRGCASICAKARRLIRKGFDPDAMLYAWRGTTLCFAPMPLRHWAGLRVREDDRGIRFEKYAPPPQQPRSAPCLPPDTAVAAAEVG